MNKQDSNGRTPFHYACDARIKHRIKLLLQNGADVHIRDNNQHTGLEIYSHYLFMPELLHLYPVIQQIEAYETFAASPANSSPYMTMLKATQMRLEHNLPKVPLPPLECYNNMKEWETVEELDSYKDDEDRLRIQGLLARERIYKGRYVYLITGPPAEGKVELRAHVLGP